MGEAQRMEFVLQKEQQEAERKKIEAQGIADFQKIVSDDISPNLLKWKGIEATEKLAKSPNSKIVIMGNSKDSLPVILGQDDGMGATGPSSSLPCVIVPPVGALGLCVVMRNVPCIP